MKKWKKRKHKKNSSIENATFIGNGTYVTPMTRNYRGYYPY